MNEPYPQTPAFQLNLILWLSWFSPSQLITGIRPIFREYGLTLHSIERVFSLPPRKRIMFSNAEIETNVKADPDVLLKHESRPFLLPIECKLSSFGVASSNTKQAYTLLSITGEDMADQIGLDNKSEWDGQLIYAVGDGNHDLMHQTLMSLSEHIESINIQPNQYSSIGIMADSSGIYIHLENLVNEGTNDPIQVKVGSPELIYLIPDDFNEALEPNGKEVRTLEERLRIALAESIMQNIAKTDFSITEDEIMNKTIEVWDIWQKRQVKKGLLRRAIRPYLRKVVDEMRKIEGDTSNDSAQTSTLDVYISNKNIYFPNITRKMRKQIMDYLSSSRFRDGDISLISNTNQKSFGDLPDVDGW